MPKINKIQVGVTIAPTLHRKALRLSKKRFGKSNFSKLIEKLIESEILSIKEARECKNCPTCKTKALSIESKFCYICGETF
jgi:hypothetical protein